MKMWIFTLIAVATTLAPQGHAYPTYQESLPNGGNLPHPCKPNYRWPGVGHLSPLGGGALNPFGEDFKRQGYVWTLQLCQMDSDGDGMTNGQELGDPQCTWQPGQIPQEVKGTSHPGVCDPHGAPQCQGRNDFVSCELDEFEVCDAIKTPDIITLDVTFPRHTIPNTETNYMCMTFDLPADKDYHLVANEAIMDNLNVLHHMILFGCSDPDGLTIDSPTHCGMAEDAGDCRTQIALWTVGQAGFCHRDNVGFRVGKSQYSRVLLQTHYNNPELVTDYTDASGMKLYLKPSTPELLDLATFTTGQRILEIPPGQSRVAQVGVCPGSCTRMLVTKPAYIVNAANHMHYMGREMKIELFRNGKLVLELTNEEQYSYDTPTKSIFDPPVQMLPGDELKTTCVFSSLSSKRWVYFGDGTQDEMCIGFLQLYPSDALRQSRATCMALGPLTMACDIPLGKPVDQCDWKVFVNRTHPDTEPWWTKVVKDCNLDGFCRPECREVVDVVKGPILACKERSQKRSISCCRCLKKGLSFSGKSTPARQATHK